MSQREEIEVVKRTPEFDPEKRLAKKMRPPPGGGAAAREPGLGTGRGGDVTGVA